MSKATLFACIISLVHSQLNPSGPIHSEIAANCLLSLALTQFKPMDSEFGLAAIIINATNNHTSRHLLTIITSDFPSSPAYEIQSLLLKKLNTAYALNLEIANKQKDITIKELNDEYETKTHESISYAIIITTSIQHFNETMTFMFTLPNYNPRALFLVYFTQRLTNIEHTINQIVHFLWLNFVYNVIVVTPKTLRLLHAYVTDFEMAPARECTHQATRFLGDCHALAPARIYYPKPRLPAIRSFNRCRIDVIAHINEPFVISEHEGIEMVLLKTLEDELQLDFNTYLTDEDSWGTNDPNSGWTGDLGRIWTQRYIGIGNFIYVFEHYGFFDRLVPHFTANLVWVVPLARLVPKWRVLTIIFGWDLWLVCIGVILASSIMLKVSGRGGNYAKWGYSSLVAFQVLLTCSTYRQPVHDWTRITFIALAVFSIIISAVYTSSLINYLQNPIREPQINSFDDIFRKGLDVGGLSIFLQMFNASEDEKSMDIYERYEVNESATYWWKSVADDRDTATMATESSMKYMLANNYPILTLNGTARVFVVKKDKILSYGVSIVFHRSFPFKAVLNHYLIRMMESGLIMKLAVPYTGKKLDSDTGSKFVHRLSIDNIQGAFTLLILGYVFGLVAFVMEILVRIVTVRLCTKK